MFRIIKHAKLTKLKRKILGSNCEVAKEINGRTDWE